ncbi:hypothetical protein B0T17DRAFT_407944 [Bombardia bombarda]|uniref:Uncharacterized protein n=1 Tax=Bombardia bombarda TaxID=252184 RepID=A0AA39U763_9PEZI|nr:hypothetical protein B0T17DRAFT_407944 [Bombardia bombarda]
MATVLSPQLVEPVREDTNNRGEFFYPLLPVPKDFNNDQALPAKPQVQAPPQAAPQQHVCGICRRRLDDQHAPIPWRQALALFMVYLVSLLCFVWLGARYRHVPESSAIPAGDCSLDLVGHSVPVVCSAAMRWSFFASKLLTSVLLFFVGVPLLVMVSFVVCYAIQRLLGFHKGPVGVGWVWGWLP